MRRAAALLGAAALVVLGLLLAPPALALDLVETPELAARVAAGALPPVAERLPRTPLVVDLAGRGREAGRHGGEVRTLVARSRDLRSVTVNAYARLVGYDERFALHPDILEAVENDGDRVITFTLREGHRWSDGHPFTAEDFRYWFEDVAGSKELSPGGLPEFMLIEGKGPAFEVLDPRRVRFTFPGPNPRFLPHLAGAMPVTPFAPGHYLKAFNPKFGDKEVIKKQVAEGKLRSWAQLHNRMDDPRENANPDMPTLGPWRVTTRAPATRFVFERNPYYHRVDPAGRQLPYVDRVVADVSAPGLFAAKANAGEVDLMARGLVMADVPVLKQGERARGYRTLLWREARGTAYALVPNLNAADPAWRALNRDVRFRRALSHGIDRKLINNALLFGLGREGNDTVDPASPLFDPDLLTRHAAYDPAEANRLLDAIGLTGRDGSGLRLLPDGRPLEIVVEADGEGGDLVDALGLMDETLREVGVKLFVKPQDRGILRTRAYAGLAVMTASAGLDNAVPTPGMSPAELAPMRQDNLAWPKWGQFVETKGTAGERPDLPEAAELLRHFEAWTATADDAAQAAAWRAMLANKAENQWVIGTVAGAIQPVVVNARLRNLPERALYSFEPTANLGVYRIDELFYADGPKVTLAPAPPGDVSVRSRTPAPTSRSAP